MLLDALSKSYNENWKKKAGWKDLKCTQSGKKKKKKFFKVVNKNVMVVKKLTPLTTNQIVCNRT
jgi:hypothetical protein